MLRAEVRVLADIIGSVSEEDVLGPRFTYYRAEAVVVASRAFTAALDAGRHVLWVSGAAELDELRHVVGRRGLGLKPNEKMLNGTGLALSGGGIRSATFCLGVAQVRKAGISEASELACERVWICDDSRRDGLKDRQCGRREAIQGGR